MGKLGRILSYYTYDIDFDLVEKTSSLSGIGPNHASAVKRARTISHVKNRQKSEAVIVVNLPGKTGGNASNDMVVTVESEREESSPPSSPASTRAKV